jgi:hypothetical protein
VQSSKQLKANPLVTPVKQGMHALQAQVPAVSFAAVVNAMLSKLWQDFHAQLLASNFNDES